MFYRMSQFAEFQYHPAPQTYNLRIFQRPATTLPTSVIKSETNIARSVEIIPGAIPKTNTFWQKRDMNTNNWAEPF